MGRRHRSSSVTIGTTTAALSSTNDNNNKADMPNNEDLTACTFLLRQFVHSTNQNQEAGTTPFHRAVGAASVARNGSDDDDNDAILDKDDSIATVPVAESAATDIYNNSAAREDNNMSENVANQGHQNEVKMHLHLLKMHKSQSSLPPSNWPIQEAMASVPSPSWIDAAIQQQAKTVY